MKVWLGAILSAVLMALSFDLWSFMAWFALIPLLLVIDSCAKKTSFYAAWAGGSLFFALHLYWLNLPVLDFGGVFALPGVIGLSVVYILFGFFWALFLRVGQYLIAKYNSNPVLILPSLWFILEFLRVKIFSPLPMGVLGYTQASYPLIIQIADLIGSLGISFLIVFFNCAFFYFWRKKLSLIKFLAISIVLFLMVIPYGYYRLNQEGSPIVQLGIVQGNIEQEEKFDPNLVQQNIDNHIELSLKLDNIDLIVWPESAVPVAPNRNISYWSGFQEQLRSLAAPVVLGLLNPVNRKVFNSAYLTIDGEIITEYQKNWLVPFGEYIPFSSVFGFIDIGFSGNTPGDEIVIFKYDGLDFAAPICYEIMNVNLMREMALASDYLLNLSNEAWFRESKGLKLLWNITIMRSVETRTPIVKVANTGFSGFIDDRGRVELLLPPHQRAQGSAQVFSANLTSLYLKGGDLPIFIIVLVFLLFVVKQSHKKKI